MHYKDYIADPSRDCAIVAHRGAWHGAPENSLAAIERAIAVGSDIVELDVRKSADGVLFLMHDDTLLRMTGIDRDAESLTMAQLQAIALRGDDGGPHRSATDQRIPTLNQALELIRGRIFADLDLKDRRLFCEVAACAKEMRAASFIDLKTLVRSRQDLDWVRAQDIGDVAFMAMTRLDEQGIEDTMALLSQINPFMCEIRFDRLSTIANNRDLFQEARMSLWVNTLNQIGSGEWRDDQALLEPDSIWGRLLDAGVSVLQTDEPEALKAYVMDRRA